MRTARFLIPVVTILFLGVAMQAQEWDPDPVDSAELYQVEYFKFDAENAGEARKIIKDYFNIASDLAGFPRPLMEMEINSEDFNYMVLWELNKGDENLSWQSCPTNEKWYDAFVTVAGSEERAKEIIERYDSFITASKTEIGRRQ